MAIQKTGEDAYFVASNSANGFCSYYSECFDSERIRHVYAIKGGPGTGKSFFLREVLRFGEAHGWHSEVIYCSSDPDSLDGVLLFRDGTGLAFLDATAPHVYEPTHPGLREELVDLGIFWNAKLLAKDADHIRTLQTQKSKAYGHAYRYLASVGELAQVRDSLVSPYVDLHGIERYARKMMQSLPTGERYTVQPALIASVGMKGYTRLDTYFRNAERIYCVEDCKGIADCFLHAIGSCAIEKRQAIRISKDPILPDRIDGICFSDARISFVVCKEKECPYPHKTLKLRRFLRISEMGHVRKEVAYAERMMQAMLRGAEESLLQAHHAHFELERIYTATMDFASKEAFTRMFCEKILT